MKKKCLLILIFLIGILFSCNNNKNPKKIEFLFAPSFLNQTKFTIDVKNKTIEEYSSQTSYSEYKRNEANQIENITKDTLIVHYKKTFKISDENLQDFLNELELSQFNKTVKHGEKCLDGVGFRISKIDMKNDTISLTTSNPLRNNKYKTDYKLLDAFFELSYKTINDYKGICNVENIQDYFNYGLPIRLISKIPLEYRVWGRVSGCREDNLELISFFNKLPYNKPVLFDLRNGSFSICLYEVLGDFSKKKKLYFFGKDETSEYKKEIEELKTEIEEAKKNNKDYSDLEEKYKDNLWNYQESIYVNKLLNKNIEFYYSKEEILKNCR